MGLSKTFTLSQQFTTMTNGDIAKEFCIARSTFLRYVANYKRV